MTALREVQLVDASVPETATLVEAVAALFDAKVPAVAVLDVEGKVLGIFSERDLLRAVFPGYLAELRHTAFLRGSSPVLGDVAEQVRGQRIGELARRTDVLGIDDGAGHAAERLMHSNDDALPVVDGERFVGMLSVAALCQARLDPQRSG